MILCPVALAVGCKRCPIFAVCPLKSSIGDYTPPVKPEPEKADPKKTGSKKVKNKKATSKKAKSKKAHAKKTGAKIAK